MKRLFLLLAGALPILAQAKLPPYTREVLPNGAVILLMPRAGVPLVHFRILVRGGIESGPPQLAGLASVTAELLRRGTAKRTADQFSEELDFLGGTFGANPDSRLGSATAISAEFLSKDFDQGLDLVSDAVFHPAFTDSEVRKEVARRVDAARAMKDNAGPSIGSYALAAFFGPGHPYGHPADELTLAKIERKDIVAYHQKFYTGNNTIVILTGDFDAAAAKTKLAAAFGAASQGPAFEWATVPAVARHAGLLLIDKPDATQTYFEIVQPGIDIKSADRTALHLVNTLFGGRFTSMLNDELRVNSGLTYGAGSSVDQARLSGAIAISTYTKTATTARAMDLALDVLKRFNERGITAEQLASAKAYVKGLYPTQSLETIDDQANMLGRIELYGLGREETDGYFARIDAVTLDQANAMIRKYYRTDDLTFVVLGVADKIRDVVKKYNPRMTEVSIKTPGWD